MIKEVVKGVYGVRNLALEVKEHHSDISDKVVVSNPDKNKEYPLMERHIEWLYFFNKEGENIAYYVDGDLVILQKGRPFTMYPTLEEYVL